MSYPSFTLWFTGLSGAGKTTLSKCIERKLQEAQREVERLDGDEIRAHLSAGLGFSKQDRDTNIRRIGWVAKLLNRHNTIALVAAISPYRAVRDEMRASMENFVEVYCDASLAVLQQRDPKGLYKKAATGEIKNFTGLSDPYEPPLTPEIHLKTDAQTIEQSVELVFRYLRKRGFMA